MFRNLQRRLLLVDFNDECLALIPKLEEWGWIIQACDLEQAQEYEAEVALICLTALHPSERIKSLISRSRAEWIALVKPELLQRPGMGEFIYEWFFDFHRLPLDVERIKVGLGRASGMAHIRQLDVSRCGDPEHELLGESAPILSLRRLLTKLARAESPVLIRGESGTGKELVACSLHRQSRRATQPFSAINCGAISEHLIQSELFGHEKGAFTGAHQRKIGRIEAVDGGTLFLDEVGDLPLELQANLLRFLQEKTIERVGSSKSIAVDVRVIAATHLNLEQAIEQGRFREDLYYRLNVLQVQTTPLRERLDDLRLLSEHFVRLYSGETGKRARRLSEAALRAMREYSWPGNVRELTNRVRRGLVLAEGREISAADLGLEPSNVEGLVPLEACKHQAEQQALRLALSMYSHNLSNAALALGVSRPTFYRLLHKHQIR